MRRLVLTAGLVVMLAGCGSSAQTAKNPEPPDDSPAPTIHQARLGDLVRLTGADAAGHGRLQLAVKVKQVVRSATGQGPFETPRKGERFVAVRIVLKNLGDTTYDDSPTYGAKLVDDTGQGYDPTVATVSAGPGFARLVRLRRGQTAGGFVVFAVPRTAHVTLVQYSLYSGVAEDRGQWRLA